MARYRQGFVPQETLWNGVLFRSRLEVRWAVFFTVLGTPFIYEPTMLAVKTRNIYLPDFYLPAWNCFFEVKPSPPTRAEAQKAQLLSLATDAEVQISTTTFHDARLLSSLRFLTVYRDRPPREAVLHYCTLCGRLDFQAVDLDHDCGRTEPHRWNGIAVPRRRPADAFVAALTCSFESRKKTP